MTPPMQQALSIYQQPPPTAVRGTRLEFVARHDLGFTFPHLVVTHRFYFLSASIVSTVIAPREDDRTPRRSPDPQRRRPGRAARTRDRQAPRQMARREQELGICAREIANTPHGTVKISAFMDTVGDFHFVVRLRKYPTVWHLKSFEASEVIATLETESMKVRYFRSAVKFGLGI